MKAEKIKDLPKGLQPRALELRAECDNYVRIHGSDIPWQDWIMMTGTGYYSQLVNLLGEFKNVEKITNGKVVFKTAELISLGDGFFNDYTDTEAAMRFIEFVEALVRQSKAELRAYNLDVLTGGEE